MTSLIAGIPDGFDEHLVALLRPSSWEAERYRALRHTLLQRRGGCPNVVAVTSPTPGDGKTTTAINLAAALAETDGAHVLLIDSDMRCSTAGAQVGLRKASPGLAEGIQDDSLTLSTLVRNHSRCKFGILPAGATPRAPHELLESPRLGELMQQARRMYGVVVVDTPPVVPVTDCMALAKWVDGFVLVVAAHRTPRKLVEEALNLIGPKKLLGIVFNGDDGPLWGSNRYDRYYRNTTAA
jgi:capsular exopolysaccharide synthesis family protein